MDKQMHEVPSSRLSDLIEPTIAHESPELQSSRFRALPTNTQTRIFRDNFTVPTALADFAIEGEDWHDSTITPTQVV